MPILKPTSTFSAVMVCVLLFGAVEAPAAQSNATVSGAIRDATGAVLPGATVTLQGPETRRVQTGPSGEFEFGGLKAGEYVLRVEAPGFSSMAQTLRVGAGRTAPLAIMLDVAATDATIVTASRTGPSDMQSLPMAVSAVSARELDRTQTRSIEQAVSLVPSVTFTQNSTFGQLSIRGVGTNLPNAGGDPSSAIYLDGVYLARPAMVFMDLLDLDRIEVLRGPQGTLYGRNAVGGALQLISRAPSTEFEADARIAAGSFGGLRGEGRVSGALKRDAVIGSLAMARAVRDGYVHDLNHQQHLLGGDDLWSARGQLRFLFTANTDLLLSGDYGDQQGIPLTYNKVLQVKPGFTIDNPPALHDVRTSTLAAGRVTQHGATARVNAALSPSMRLTSLTAWRGLRNDFYVDADITELDLFAARSEERQHQWSQELTVTQTRQRATWVGGVFLMSEHDRQTVHASQPQARVDVLLNPTVDARSTAAFGELTVRATRAISAIVGARYSRERKTIDNAGGRYTLEQPPQLLGGQYAYVDSISHAAWTPKVGVDWTPRPGALLYATATRGFKSGGFNWSSPVPGRGFAPEFAWSYEGGLKTTFASAHGRVNVAAFTMDYNNLQVQTPIGIGVFDVRNAAEATVRGVELEAAADLGHGLQTGGHVTWLDARYDEYIAVDNSNTAGNVAGRRLNNAPQFSGRSWIEWRAQVHSTGSVAVTADATAQSTVFFTPFNDAIQRQTPYALLGARVEYAPQHRRWSLNAYIKNLLDARYIMAAFGTSPVAYGGRPGAPREFGVALVVRR